MAEKDLEASADLIAQVKVLRVAAYGKPYADHCYKWQRVKATLRVLQRSKGTSPRIIHVIYAYRRGYVDPKHKCVGGRTSYYLQKGKKYELYLRRSGNKKGKPAQYGFINWAGVRQIR